MWLTSNRMFFGVIFKKVNPIFNKIYGTPRAMFN